MSRYKVLAQEIYNQTSVSSGTIMAIQYVYLLFRLINVVLNKDNPREFLIFSELSAHCIINFLTSNGDRMFLQWTRIIYLCIDLRSPSGVSAC